MESTRSSRTFGDVVFIALEFVAHDGHFAIEILAGDEGVDHAVGFHFQGPAQIFGGGVEGFEVIGAVVIGGGVFVDRAVGVELREDFAVVRGALEHHVLQQMGHAGFAVAFLPRADHVGDVDGDGGLGIIGEEQHLEAVGEAILGDAFDRGDLCWSGGWVWAGVWAKTRPGRRARDARILMGSGYHRRDGGGCGRSVGRLVALHNLRLSAGQGGTVTLLGFCQSNCED